MFVVDPASSGLPWPCPATMKSRSELVRWLERSFMIDTQTISSGAAADQPLASAGPSTSPRRDHLRATLLSTVDLLYRRRADLIGEGTIGDYLALHWLEWNGGGLRLTVTGHHICEKLKAERRASQGE
jgi:hypothetical protein